jgi:EmrB/QacA subfamily drug resistance transporter
MTAAVHAIAAGGPSPKQNIRLIFFALTLVLLLASLDQTIVATALPTIVGEIGGIAHLSWIVTSYLLATTVVTPLYGKLGDLFGRKIVLQAAIVIFLAGSALCGMSQNLIELILFRFLQGLGGGGLLVVSMAVIADVIPPAERGRYQGFFGAVFGVSTILGPLIGGFFVVHLTWRWIFYINLPLGLIALFVISTAFYATTKRVSHTIDYLGAVLLTGALTGIVLLTSLGGTELSATPAGVWTLMVLAIVALGIGFILVENRAKEPVLPLTLFRNRVFAVASAVSLLVGFALFGSTTLLPVYLQVVKGADPAIAGLHMTPMMGGVLLTSVVSGRIIVRIGRYKLFPIVGTAVMTAAFFLLSTLDAESSIWFASADMLLLGLGLGMTMQVLVLAVQNAVDYEHLGVATSGATLFRFVGGSLGVALFGGIFALALESQLAAFSGSAVVSGLSDPAAVAALPPAVHALYIRAFAEALHPVFETAAAVSFAGFLLTFALKELHLRKTAGSEGIGQAFAMPQDATSLEELERIVTRLTARENRWRVYDDMAREARVDLDPQEIWFMRRLGDREHAITIADLAAELKVDAAALAAMAERVKKRGLIEADASDRLDFTPAGRQVYTRVVAARRAQLERLLEGWSPEKHPDVKAMLAKLARSLVVEPPTLPESKAP